MKALFGCVLLVMVGCSRSEQPHANAKSEAKPADDRATQQLRPEHVQSLRNARIATLEGQPSSLAKFDAKALLLVNVASKCGNTPQYEKLEALQRRYAARGFSVVGFPCNQFEGQEPGTPEEIRAFCTTNYGVTFPLMEKIEVNGPSRHPIYAVLTQYVDATGTAGDVSWNFEKFLISADRRHVWRFRPSTQPDDSSVITALEAALP